MMMSIFHDGKKSCVGDKKKNQRLNKMIVFVIFFSFSVNKKKKNYKAKFSTNLILKKKPTKIILEGKKPMKKNVVAIDNVL